MLLGSDDDDEQEPKRFGAGAGGAACRLQVPGGARGVCLCAHAAAAIAAVLPTVLLGSHLRPVRENGALSAVYGRLRQVRDRESRVVGPRGVRPAGQVAGLPPLRLPVLLALGKVGVDRISRPPSARPAQDLPRGPLRRPPAPLVPRAHYEEGASGPARLCDVRGGGIRPAQQGGRPSGGGLAQEDRHDVPAHLQEEVGGRLSRVSRGGDGPRHAAGRGDGHPVHRRQVLHAHAHPPRPVSESDRCVPGEGGGSRWGHFGPFARRVVGHAGQVHDGLHVHARVRHHQRRGCAGLDGEGRRRGRRRPGQGKGKNSLGCRGVVPHRERSHVRGERHERRGQGLLRRRVQALLGEDDLQAPGGRRGCVCGLVVCLQPRTVPRAAPQARQGVQRHRGGRPRRRERHLRLGQGLSARRPRLLRNPVKAFCSSR
mmetsp:Transcript_10691/g.22123  ORF Transcript_10691/g.22123 Transcript_10691/m.22123 type:complete len:428 (+) Transcript_10691:190-1473(+)